MFVRQGSINTPQQGALSSLASPANVQSCCGFAEQTAVVFFCLQIGCPVGVIARNMEKNLALYGLNLCRKSSLILSQNFAQLRSTPQIRHQIPRANLKQSITIMHANHCAEGLRGGENPVLKCFAWSAWVVLKETARKPLRHSAEGRVNTKSGGMNICASSKCKNVLHFCYRMLPFVDILPPPSPQRSKIKG